MRKNVFFKFVVLALLGCIVVGGFAGCEMFGNGDEKWVNSLSDLGMQANMTIFCKSYNTDFLGREESSATFFGSGIIFNKNENSYFLLTNNHVVFLQNGYNKKFITVRDYKGVEYEAVCVFCDENYDLAVLSFSVAATTAAEKEYTPIPVARQNPAKGTRVASLGQPHGQYNCLTLGKINSYQLPIAINDIDAERSNVNFEVMCHTAPIATGSSGGAVIDQNMLVVGINYSSANNIEDNSYAYSRAVPAEKIWEFLANEGFSAA